MSNVKQNGSLACLDSQEMQHVLHMSCTCRPCLVLVTFELTRRRPDDGECSITRNSPRCRLLRTEPMCGWTAGILKDTLLKVRPTLCIMLRYVRARPADLPFGGWYPSDTKQFRLIILMRRKSMTQPG